MPPITIVFSDAEFQTVRETAENLGFGSDVESYIRFAARANLGAHPDHQEWLETIASRADLLPISLVSFEVKDIFTMAEWLRYKPAERVVLRVLFKKWATEHPDFTLVPKQHPNEQQRYKRVR